MFDIRTRPAILLDGDQRLPRDLPDHYIRVTAFDSTHGTESVAMSFIVNRPKNEPASA